MDKHLLNSLIVIFILLLFIFNMGCSNSEKGSATLSNPSVTPPQIEDPIPEVSLDHSDRFPPYATLPTEEECLRLQDWQDNGFQYTFYFKYTSAIGGGFLRFDEDGVIHMSGTPSNPLGGLFLNNDVIDFGNCTIHVINSLDGIDFVEWN